MHVRTIYCQIPLDIIYNKYYIYHAGADPGFQVRGAHFKKSRRAEGGAKTFGVFRVKNYDFTQKNIFFPILGGGWWSPPLNPPLPWILRISESEG